MKAMTFTAVIVYYHQPKHVPLCTDGNLKTKTYEASLLVFALTDEETETQMSSEARSSLHS